jgi:hypothetical protein
LVLPLPDPVHRLKTGIFGWNGLGNGAGEAGWVTGFQTGEGVDQTAKWWMRCPVTKPPKMLSANIHKNTAANKR